MALFRLIANEENSFRGSRTVLLNSKRCINWKSEGTGVDLFYAGISDGGRFKQLRLDSDITKATLETMLDESGANDYFDVTVTQISFNDLATTTTYGVLTDRVIYGYDLDTSSCILWVETNDGEAIRLKLSMTIQEVDVAAGSGLYYYLDGAAIGSTSL